MLKKLFGALGDKNNELLSLVSSGKFNVKRANSLLQSGVDLDWENENGENYFHLAVKNNNTLAIKWLVSKSIDINKNTKNKKTPIFYAIQKDSTNILSILIENGADENHKNNFNRTVLQEAVIANKNSVIDYLLKIGVDINNIDSKGRSIIFDSVTNGTKSLVEKISSLENLDINLKDANNKTVMHEKNVLANPELAYVLMDNGAKPTICDNNGRNFLFYLASVAMENDKLIDRVIAQGCSINSRDNNNETVLMQTINLLLQTEDEELREILFSMVEKFISLGVNINAKDNQGNSVLLNITKAKDKELLKYFLSLENIDINIQDNYGNTPLCTSIIQHDHDDEIISELLEKGANPNTPDLNNASILEKLIDIILYLDNGKDLEEELQNEISKEKNYMMILKEILSKSQVKLNIINSKSNPLFFDVVLYNNKNLFSLLKKHGINISQKDKNGENIAFKLIDEIVKIQDEKKKKEMLYSLSTLINSGLNINSKNNEGRTPVHEAVLKACSSTARVFIDAKPNLKLADKKGRNVVHCCVWDGKVEHFKMIARKDRDVVNLPDLFGLLPIHYAAFMGHTPLVLKMIESGSYVNSNRVVNMKMIDYLRKFTVVLDTLEDKTTDLKEKVNLRTLTDNMKKEFAL